MPSSKVSSIVGWTVVSNAPVVKGSILACIYAGSAGNVSIEKETGLLASDLATLSKAEEMAKAIFPKGTRITFTPLTALGYTSYYWTAVLGGSPFSGANTNRGTTGYYAEMSGRLQRTALLKLDQLAIST